MKTETLLKDLVSLAAEIRNADDDAVDELRENQEHLIPDDKYTLHKEVVEIDANTRIEFCRNEYGIFEDFLLFDGKDMWCLDEEQIEAAKLVYDISE